MKDSRDNRSTLIAVIIGAVVGLASPLIAYVSLKENTKAAVVISDTEELRTVTDKALEDLTELRSRATGKRNTWRREVLNAPPAHTAEEASERRARVKTALAAEQQRLTKRFNATRADGDRLWIRVGHGDIHNSYWNAYHEYGEVGACTGYESPQLHAQDDRIKALLQQAKDWGTQFRNLAYDRMRSEPRPEDTAVRLSGDAEKPATSTRPLTKLDFLECSDFYGARKEATRHGGSVEDGCTFHSQARREFVCDVRFDDGRPTQQVTVVKVGKDAFRVANRR